MAYHMLCQSSILKSDVVSQFLSLSSGLHCNEAGDDGVAVASAGPYANHLHLALER